MNKQAIMDALMKSKRSFDQKSDRVHHPSCSIFETFDDNDPMASIEQCVWSASEECWMGPPLHHTSRLRKMEHRLGSRVLGPRGFGEFDVIRREYWRELAGVHDGWNEIGYGHHYKSGDDSDESKSHHYWNKSFSKLFSPIMRDMENYEYNIHPPVKTLGIDLMVVPSIHVGSADHKQRANIYHASQKDGRVTILHVARNNRFFYQSIFYSSSAYLERILVAGRMLT